MTYQTNRPAPATTIFADTETIPTQRLDVLKEMMNDSIAERDAELAKLSPPKNIKKAETIAAWYENELPVKKEEIVAKYDAALKEAIHKTGVDGAFGQLAVISLAADNEDPIALWDPNWSAPGYEAWLLHQLDAAMRHRCGHHRGQMLVGHNIAFDRRMIRQRGIILGVPVHAIFTREVKPWENDIVFDTMLAWTGDHRLVISMDKLCRALGIAGKGSDLDDGEYIDGSQVWEFVQRGEIGKVARYCCGDVGRTREIYQILRGTKPRPRPPVFVPTPLDPQPVVPQPLHIGVDIGAPSGDRTETYPVQYAGVEPPCDDEPPPADEAPALEGHELPGPF